MLAHLNAIMLWFKGWMGGSSPPMESGKGHKAKRPAEAGRPLD